LGISSSKNGLPYKNQYGQYPSDVVKVDYPNIFDGIDDYSMAVLDNCEIGRFCQTFSMDLWERIRKELGVI
jgi:hypothetical protein